MGQDGGGQYPGWQQGQGGPQRHLPPWPPQGQQPPPADPDTLRVRRQAPAPPPPVPQARKPRRKLSWKAWGCLTVLAVLAALVIIIIVAVVNGSRATFTAREDGITVVNPAAVDVTLKVTNTGTSPATPSCTVNASDSSGAYTGINEGTLSGPVQPGQTVTTVMEITITHQGAQYVTQATVSCVG